ncbi:MAG TPA: phosphoglycolate phosphatase [Gammaproteobacteria bacterium]|nr:phosphoglycolate phosphatase [Gammaproteobacteria bacterium]
MADKLNTVLFDLDGTLIDTAPDMVAALNRMLVRHGKAELPYARVRNTVSRGSLALVKLGFSDKLPETELKDLQNEYLAVYAESLCAASRPFEGMTDILSGLEAAAVRWGVVTNKPGWLTEPLLKQLGLYGRAGCIVSGDTLPVRKPDPAPLLHAAQLVQRKPQECVYVGDDQRDVDAGRAAGMRTLVALYGYIGDGENPRQWGADDMIGDIAQLRRWLQRHVL